MLLPPISPLFPYTTLFRSYPALEDHDTACQIVVLDDPQKAQKAHQQGLKRLFLLQMKEPERYQRRQLQRDLLPQALQFRHFGTQEELRSEERRVGNECMPKWRP